MASLNVKPLRDDLPFGSRIIGLTEQALTDADVRQQINAIFEDRGLILFEDVEPSSRMHVAISNVFGPLKEHPVKAQAFVDPDAMPGVIEIRHDPATAGIVELEGKQLMSWLPWHFDHCYNNELNRAGVLRALDIPPEGGLTGFADGIQLYQAIAPELRQRIEGRNVIYVLDVLYDKLRFGRPRNFRDVRPKPGGDKIREDSKKMPRAVHPAVWTRKSGQKVLHVSPWMAVGIEGQEDPTGDALLEAVSQEIAAKVKPYLHHWRRTDMLIWDNWRMLHSVSGCDPKYPRRMHRTTIRGDYGLGYFENRDQGRYAALEKTV